MTANGVTVANPQPKLCKWILDVFFDKKVEVISQVKEVRTEVLLNKKGAFERLFCDNTPGACHAPVRMAADYVCGFKYLVGVEGINMAERERVI